MVRQAAVSRSPHLAPSASKGGHGEKGKIHKIKEFLHPDSLGGLYGAITEFPVAGDGAALRDC
jgi:hypothetical protein